MSDQLEFGRLLGRHETLNIVAGRCSAADAILLRDVREKKLYQGVSKDWDDCCTNQLHMSKTNANRIIQNLNEFGTQYFEVSQLTRISPATYRAILPSIQDGRLLTGGESIDLIPENADKISAAVAVIRKEAKVVEIDVVQASTEPAPVPAALPDPWAGYREALDRIVLEFQTLVRTTRDRDRLAAALGAARLKLQMLEREV